MLKDPKHPMRPGYIIEVVFRSIQEMNLITNHQKSATSGKICIIILEDNINASHSSIQQYTKLLFHQRACKANFTSSSKK